MGCQQSCSQQLIGGGGICGYCCLNGSVLLNPWEECLSHNCPTRQVGEGLCERNFHLFLSLIEQFTGCQSKDPTIECVYFSHGQTTHGCVWSWTLGMNSRIIQSTHKPHSFISLQYCDCLCSQSQILPFLSLGPKNLYNSRIAASGSFCIRHRLPRAHSFLTHPRPRGDLNLPLSSSKFPHVSPDMFSCLLIQAAH